MRLAAVMGLVVEEMIERRSKLLLDGRRIDEGTIADGAGKIGLA